MNLKESILQYQVLKPAKGELRKMRARGVHAFIQQGLPSKALESWHYTSLKDFPENRLLPVLSSSANAKQLKAKYEQYLKPNFYHLVFVNGEFSKELSTKKMSPLVEIFSLGSHKAKALIQKLIESRKACGSDFHQSSMEALNASMATGIGLMIKPMSSIKKPIHILHIKSQSTAVYPRVLVDIGEMSSVQMIESFVGEESSGSPEMLNSVTEIRLGKNAKLHHLRIQAEALGTTHIGHSRAFLDQGSQYRSLTVGSGGKLARLNLSLHCLGENAFAEVNGMTMTDDNQHIDNTTLIDHVVGNCTTSQLYKSVLGGQSKAIFCGRVQIRKDAQKASSEQLNQNLLLSEKADANSKPELGIFADDVKASHGSTIGQVSQDEIFYLMSRAISRFEAIEMLSFGFIQELVDRIESSEIRSWLSGIVQTQFRKLQKVK